MIRRTKDWDNPDSLVKILDNLSGIIGRKFSVEFRNNKTQARLYILKPRNQVTNYMTVAELRGFVEGMIVVI